MSSPLPGSQSGTEYTYQPSDTSDHALLNTIHTCQCNEKTNNDSLKCENNISPSHITNKNNHHHNILNLSSHVQTTLTNHTHPNNQAVHVHVHSTPTSVHSSKIQSSTCNCHLQSDNQSSIEIIQQSVPNRKLESDDRIEISPLPPALPPRPPPRPRLDDFNTLRSRSRNQESNNNNKGIRKYVFWCCACGGLATVLGALFLAVYFLLRSYTSTLGYFETIPTFVPATMLILTGLCVISLARRKNRYSYLIKVCGLCCLVCALTCVLVTITTTVIHMNRLQTLRECVYTQKTRTCTCYSVLLEAHASTEEGMRFVFDSTPDCEVIHGALYSCLRAMFGLSVSGILVCIFSCMLVYQLLSHEKKKMYWEQLELRCRSLYQQNGGTPASTHSSMRVPSLQTATYCSCCEECRYPPLTTGPHLYPWDTQHALERFWTPGRIGNFYSPNPGEDSNPAMTESRDRETSGWSWRRLPWNRGSTNQQPISDIHRDHSLTYQGGISSSDSQYGFSDRPIDVPAQMISDPVSSSQGSYSVLNNRPIGGVYVWGPPPPYSNPNSPARRPFQSPSRYHHIHHHPHGHNSHCQANQDLSFQDVSLRRSRALHSNKENYENTPQSQSHQSNDHNESTDTSSCVDHLSHTLPVRKMKKRSDIASGKSNMPLANSRINQNCLTYSEEAMDLSSNKRDESGVLKSQSSNNHQQCHFLPRLQGVENAAFQNQENSVIKAEPTESEVYFADVSSCCNISVKNDGQESSLYDEAVDLQKPRLVPIQSLNKLNLNCKEIVTNNQILQNFQENISSCTVTEDEEYLVHRLGNRQMSTRSRLPFPLPNSDAADLNNESCKQIIPKDMSQNSLCSSVQTPLTETTDDDLSPTSPNLPNTDFCINYITDNGNLENVQSTQPRTFSSSSIDQFLAPDAQYEAIQEQSNQENFRQLTSNMTTGTFSNLTNTISSLNNYGQNYLNANFNNENYNVTKSKIAPPKTLNIKTSTRKDLDNNISNLMLGVNSVGLLYEEANNTEDEEVQGQGCHSDGTMDSGWQSGSEKQERNNDNSENTTPRSVNV